MRRWAVVLTAVTVSLGAATAVSGAANAGNDNDPYTLSDGHAQAGPISGLVPAQDSNAARPGGGGGKNLIYHNGPVRHAVTTVQPIFVGSSWANSTFVSDKTSGLAILYQGLTSTNAYAKTNGEYTDNVGAVNPGLNYVNFATDFQTNFAGDPGGDAIANEVVHAVGTPVAGGYYPVYITAARGSAGYCAWHDTATVNGVQFQIGFFFNLDGDSGCDPQSPSSLGHTQGLSALANVTGHEYSEMVTDPQVSAWWDQQGNENADKCAWTFGASPLSIGTASWKIQGNWSNAAYNAGRGYGTGRKKVVGCIDGTNAA